MKIPNKVHLTLLNSAHPPNRHRTHSDLLQPNIADHWSKMAKLMKSFIGQIGGIAGRVTGSDTYEAEVDKESRIRESPVESKLSLSGSEEADVMGGSSSNEEEFCYEQQVPSMKGSLNKWTNYLHGWQERYFVVGEGILSYYKSEFDTQFGCRGSVSLHKAKVLVSYKSLKMLVGMEHLNELSLSDVESSNSRHVS